MIVVNGKKHYNKNHNLQFESIYKVINITDNDLSKKFFKKLWENSSEDLLVKLDIINAIINTYLTKNEKKIFELFYYYNKTPTEIYRILKYKNIYKTIWAVNIKLNKIFNLIKLFYYFEGINKTILEEKLKNLFNKQEIDIIKYLEKRYDYLEIIELINKKIKKSNKRNLITYHKLYITVKKIKKKLDETKDEDCIKYSNFLTKIKKFKKTSKTDRKIEEI